jgi:hypothetical protein
MSDNLRDRIAAVLYRTYPPYQLGYSFGCPTEKWEDESERCKEVYRRDADAVIAEMGLRQETVGLIHRWVTDWQHDKASYCLRCGIPHTTPCKRGTK